MTEEQELMENIGLVGAQAKNFAPNNVCDKDDYMQTGFMALIKASRKRDPSKGKLSTYSWPIMYREIKRKQAEKFKNKPPINKDNFCLPKINMWEVIPDNLTEDEQYIIDLKLDSYNIRQIAKKMGMKCKEVEDIFESACQKIREANLDHA